MGGKPMNDALLFALLAPKASADRRGCFRPADSCGQVAVRLRIQPSVSVQEGATRQTNRFEDRCFADAPAPRLHKRIHRLTLGQRFENLPDHDACALIRELPVAYKWIGHHVVAEFNSVPVPLSARAGSAGLARFSG